jgi:hypothetical protein
LEKYFKLWVANYLLKPDKMDNSYYFEKFKNSKNVQEKSKELENICRDLDSLVPKIKDAVDKGVDLNPYDKQRLKELNDKYSIILKGLNDEFKKFPQ